MALLVSVNSRTRGPACRHSLRYGFSLGRVSVDALVYAKERVVRGVGEELQGVGDPNDALFAPQIAGEQGDSTERIHGQRTRRSARAYSEKRNETMRLISIERFESRDAKINYRMLRGVWTFFRILLRHLLRIDLILTLT